MPSESRRLEGVYRRYRSSRTRRRRWASENPGNRAIIDELRERLLTAGAAQLERGEPVLDVGCGGGRWLRMLAERGHPEDLLHGVELIPERVASARRSLPGASIASADARHLPYESASFGLVLMLTVLSSMRGTADARAALSEGLRVLRSDGVLLVYEPALRAPLNRSRLTISPSRLTELCTPAGEVRTLSTLTLAPPLARRLGRRGARAYPALASLRPLRTHYLAVVGPNPVKAASRARPPRET